MILFRFVTTKSSHWAYYHISINSKIFRKSYIEALGTISFKNFPSSSTAPLQIGHRGHTIDTTIHSDASIRGKSKTIALYIYNDYTYTDIKTKIDTDKDTMEILGISQAIKHIINNLVIFWIKNIQISTDSTNAIVNLEKVTQEKNYDRNTKTYTLSETI